VVPILSNEELTPEESLAANGESFYWAKKFLGKGVGKDAAQLYAFCRLLDDMADGDIHDGPQRLAVIQRNLKNGEESSDRALTAFLPLLNQKNFPKEVVLALIEGLLDDQDEKVEMENVASLMRYAYKVAGTVGLLMCHVLDCTDSRARSHAIDLGIGMQLTNIARDVLEDAKMNRRYIPGDWINHMGPDEIIEASKNPDSQPYAMVQSSVKRLLDLAEIFYASGVRGLAYLPFRAHVAISIAGRVYRQIGVEIRKNGYRWENGKCSVTKSKKVICSLQANSTLLRRFSFRRVKHNTNLHASLNGLPYVG
jgi:phytoene synthase|tara:strand:- start:4470 stop:5399 length:930 start_codon:yes stop_codon:yes gene_type:complete